MHAKTRKCEGDMCRPQLRSKFAMIRLVLIAITFLAIIGPGHSFKDQDFKVTMIPCQLAWRLTAALCSPEPGANC